MEEERQQMEYEEDVCRRFLRADLVNDFMRRLSVQSDENDEICIIVEDAETFYVLSRVREKRINSRDDCLYFDLRMEGVRGSPLGGNTYFFELRDESEREKFLRNYRREHSIS